MLAKAASSPILRWGCARPADSGRDGSKQRFGPLCPKQPAFVVYHPRFVTFVRFVPVAMSWLLAAGGMSCEREESSGLAARSEPGANPEQVELPKPSKFPASSQDKPEADASAEGEPSSSPATGPSSGEPVQTQPAPDAERVPLALAMDDDLEYVVTTVGMLELPMVSGKPTGYAREERIRLDDCTGDGTQRTCRVEHRYTQFQAEPPTGRLLENDEARVAGLTTLHRIGADGARIGATQVQGDAAAAGVQAQLTEVHRLYCIRFPTEPIAVGAKWKSRCKTFTGGRVVQREVQWELSELSRDEDGKRRAELRMVGETVSPDDEGKPRKGTVQGVLYFFVDLGKPHILRELHTTPIAEGKAAFIKRTLNHQFAHPVPGKPDELLRTDGKPLVAAPPPGGSSPAQKDPPLNAPADAAR